MLVMVGMAADLLDHFGKTSLPIPKVLGNAACRPGLIEITSLKIVGYVL